MEGLDGDRLAIAFRTAVRRIPVVRGGGRRHERQRQADSQRHLRGFFLGFGFAAIAGFLIFTGMAFSVFITKTFAGSGS